MQRGRKLYLSIFDYNKNVVCDLYDNQSDITGQATNVFITTERNGWKELSFDIPSTCIGENGPEENFRLQYLIAEYRIRAVEDGKTDWFIISEPKITRNAFSKNVSVRAGHISQNLKNKSLDLEMSDEEGNNVGTAEALLTTILEGSGWSVGYVYPFKEDDGKIKIRSLSGQAGTGALSFIESLCDVFEAKPVYNGDTQTVDLLQMNPFGKLEPGEVPKDLLDGRNVVELHYNRNIHNLEKTINSENMATRLYAYGNSGDLNGACTLQNVEHTELSFVISEVAEEYSFFGTDEKKYFFSGDAEVGDTLIWSDLDLTSRIYIWNDSKGKAYKLYNKPTTTYLLLSNPTETDVVNEFPYVTGFNYYSDVGLLTDDLLQEIADFQRSMPVLYRTSREAAARYTQDEFELSKVAESNTGFLKLKIASINYNDSDGAARFVIDTTENNGVLYRTDYDVAERRYFQWHVASDLKPNGDPVSGIGSVLFVIHNTDPCTWDKIYLKRIYNSAGELVINSAGDPGGFEYKDGDYPTSVAVWSNSVRWSASDKVYLFCTNSMTGSLGAKHAEDEAVLVNVLNVTLDGSEKHPTTFSAIEDTVPSPVGSSYEWNYRYHRTTNGTGDLYFCWGSKGDVFWHPAFVEDNPPAVVDGAYFFSKKYKTLWHGVNGEWVQYESAAEQRVANNFTKVFYYCRRRDMLYKGLYEYYLYDAVNLPVANYAIPTDYAFFWTFTTDRTVTGELKLDVIAGHVYQDTDIEHIVTSSVIPYDTVFYPSENEFAGMLFSQGTIDITTGVEQDAENRYRSNSIRVWENTVYEYDLPANSSCMFYDISLGYISGLALTSEAGQGVFTTPAQTRYVRIVSSAVPTGYLRTQGYNTKFYINEKPYIILSGFTGDGELLGINPLTKKFSELSDETYAVDLPALQEAQKQIRLHDASLTDHLGDMLKDGRWQDSSYIVGDEDRLYDDAMDMLRHVSIPETTYNFTYLDMYGVENEHYYETHESQWPDIDIMDAAHLVDMESNTNCWAYIDKVHKCYDQQWRTEIEVDTKLSLASRHGFTDVIARIAEVAKEIKSKQSQYDRAAVGNVDGSRLEGEVALNQIYLNGGASNWYTDDNGNIIFESADGLSAMILGGRGLGVATGKNASGDWEFRTAATGYGITADEITTGILRADLIDAHSITADKLMSNVGQELEIGSNKALALFATIDGSRPAGTVHTTDGLIEIKAGYEQGGQTIPAEINVQSGGAVNVEGGKVNISANGSGSTAGELNVSSTGKFTLSANGADNIDSTANGLFIDSTQGVNFGGGRFKVVANGNTSTVNMTAGYVAIGDPNNEAAILRMNANEGIIDLKANNKINIYANKSLQLLSGGGNVVIGNGSSPFTVGADRYVFVSKEEFINHMKTTDEYIYASDADKALLEQEWSDIYDEFHDQASYDRAFIYNGRTNIYDVTHDGVYLGTDGISIGKNNSDYIVATADGNLDVSGTIRAKNLYVGGSRANLAVDSEGLITLGSLSSSVQGVINKAAGITIDTETGQILLSAAKFDHLGVQDATGLYITPNSIDIGTTGTFTLDSTNLNVTADGTVTATSLALNGGSITLKDGNATKFSVTNKGYMTAVSGQIAGWEIGDTTLTGNETGIAKTTNDNDIAFWAGNTTASNGNFRVTQGGKLYATGAEISGNSTFAGSLNAATGSFAGTVSAGAVVACDISANNIKGGTLVLGGANNTSGTISIRNASNTEIGSWTNAGIVATAGEIGGWTIGTNSLHSGSGTTYVELNSNTSSDYAIWAGANSASSAPFKVKRTGEVYFTKLIIQKEANAGSGGTYTTEELNLTSNDNRLRGGTILGWRQDSTTGDTTIYTTYGDLTFNRASLVSGSWTGTTYTAVPDPQGAADAHTSVYLEIEVGGYSLNPNENINAKIYKDNPSVSANQLTVKAMTLVENVSAKTVTLETDGLTKGSVSIVSTYNAGWDGAISARVTSGAAASASQQAIKILTYDEKWDVKFTIPNSAGVDQVSHYVVQAPSDRYNLGWTNAAEDVLMPSAGTGETFIVKIPNSTPDGEQQTRTFTMTKGTPGTSGYAAVSYNNQTVARIDISNWYTSGWSAAVGKVDANFTVSTGSVKLGVPSSTVGSGTTKSIAITLDTSAAWASGSKTVWAKAGGTNCISGSVSIPDGSISVAATWSGGSKSITASTGGKQIASSSVSIPGITSASLGAKGTGTNWTVNVNIGDTTKSSTLNCSAAYNAGWNDCRAAFVDQMPAAYKALYYGSWQGTLFGPQGSSGVFYYDCISDSHPITIPGTK